MNRSDSRLADLLSRLLDDEVSEDDASALAHLLRGNSEAQQTYLDLLLIDELLREEFPASDEQDLNLLARWKQLSTAGDHTQSSITDESKSPSPELPADDRALTLRRHPVRLAVVSLAIAASFWIFWAWLLQSSREDFLNRPATDGLLQVATLQSADDCRWESSETSPEPGAAVEAGRKLRLARGVARLQFVGGTDIAIEGPAELEVQSSSACFLRHGKLAALVPSSAIGFTVETPAIRVVDLGTEFGVSAEPGKQDRVHVYQGKVQITPIGGGKKSAVILRAGETAQFVPGKKSVDIANDSTTVPRFVRATRAVPHDRRVAPATIAAFWRFENIVSPATGSTVERVITDASGHLMELDYWPGGDSHLRDGGVGAYRASTEVPPQAMFARRFAVSTRSFNSGALPAQKSGMLFHNFPRNNDSLAFSHTMTLEGYFKTAGDQRSAGPMALLCEYQSVPPVPVYEVALNRVSPGSITATLQGTDRKHVVTVDKQNLCDGRWHYFALRCSGTGDAPFVSLLVGDEDGTHDLATVDLTAGFMLKRIAKPVEHNLAIGRARHLPPVEGHFRGLIDEVRLSASVLPDAELLFPIRANAGSKASTDEHQTPSEPNAP